MVEDWVHVCSPGMLATIVREVPSFGTYFVTYEMFCRWFTPEEVQLCSTAGLLLAGGLAGCSAWLISYPIDVVKSRIQADGVFHNGEYEFYCVRVITLN